MQDGAQPEADAALHLRLDDVGVDRDAAVDGADHPLDLGAALRVEADLGDLGDVGLEGLVHRDAADAALRQRRAPARLLRGKLEHAAVPRMVLQQRQTELDRVLAGGCANSSMMTSVE